MKSSNTHRGFTIIELMMVVAIVAVLATYAIPAMQGTFKANAVRAMQRELVSFFAYSRDEAVTRNKLVSMCPSLDGASCDTVTHDWSGGWLVFIDNSAAGGGDGILNNGEELLRVYQYQGKNDVAVKDPDDSLNALNSLSWTYRGFTDDDQRALIVVCADGDENFRRRGLVLERSGRVVATRDLDADEIHEFQVENDDGTTTTATDISC